MYSASGPLATLHTDILTQEKKSPENEKTKKNGIVTTPTPTVLYSYLYTSAKMTSYYCILKSGFYLTKSGHYFNSSKKNCPKTF